MLNWKDLFEKNDIDMAYEIVSDGRIGDPVWSNEGGVSFTVLDDRNYDTYIAADFEGLLISLKCSCDKGRGRIPCVHMAASLICFEDMIDEDILYDNIGMTNKEREQLPDFDGNMPGSSASEETMEPDDNDMVTTAGPGGKEDLSLPSLGSKLAELENLQMDARKERKDNKDFLNDRSTEEYRYFHYEEFARQLRFKKDKLIDAQKLIKSPVYSFDVDTGYEVSKTGAQEMTATARIKGADRTGSYVTWGARIHFTYNRLTSAVCETWNCRQHAYKNENIRSEMCEHTLACYLYLKEYLENNSIGDSTNASGVRFLNYVDRNNIKGKEEQAKDLRIEPVLNICDYGKMYLELTFKAGTDKLYVIKDISDFVNNIEDQNEYTFGKNSTVRLSENRLSDESVRWYKLMQKADNELQRAGRIASRIRSSSLRHYYGGFDTVYKLGKELNLKDELLDEFFETGKSITMDCKTDDGEHKLSSRIVLEERSLPIRLTINKDVDIKSGEFRGIVLEGDTPETFSGSEYTYYIEDGRFVRVRAEDNGLVKSLLAEEEGGYIRIQIGRRHLKEFYSKSLPVLKTIAEVTENDAEEIRSYIPPEAEYAFFLDVDEGLIICRSDVYYGARVFSLTDVIDYCNEITDKYEGFRDIQSENDICNRLYTYFPEYDPQRKVLYCDKDDENVFRLIDHGINEIMELGEVYSTGRFKRLVVHKDVKFTMGVSVESNIMHLEISSDELSREELLEIFYGYKRKQNFVKLKNGDFVRLDPDNNMAMLSEMLKSMDVSVKDFVKGKMHIPTYRALYLDKMLEQMQGVYADRDRHFKNLIREFNSIDNSDFDIPADMKGVLRNYQQLGYKWLRTLDQYGFGGILADDMGLGKTLQVISVIKAVKMEAQPGSDRMTSLVVCPASLVYNWGEELKRFAPELDFTLVLGTQDDRRALIEKRSDSDVLVTSYDLLKRDIDIYNGIRFRFQIIDEAQYIKNPNTEAAKTVKLIEADTKYALTGTPIENRLSELWSIFDYLMPGLLYSYGDFRTNMETPIVKNDDEETAKTLRRMVHPFILRRIKADVLKDLPDKLEETRYAGMDDAQRKLYDAQVVRMRKKIDETDDKQLNKSKIEILAELTRIRQICCDPSLCFEDYKGGSAKREACMDLLESLIDGGHKTLLFSQFTSMLQLLEKDLEKAGIRYYKITGSTTKEARIDMVKRFNEDDTPVFLISLKAGGTGLNLTGADSVIHYDPWWNVAAQNQATDRAHRIGQTKIVTVYRMILKNTIEEKILNMQEQKAKLADDILSGENISSASLTREDLMALLG